MENRFRNHITIILEQAGAFFWAVCLILIMNLDDIPEMLRDLKNKEDALAVLIVGGIFLVFFVINISLTCFRWFKTWISIDDTSITISRNTLNKSVNTIGIKNISNVNLEQNFLEMILGTCKVKLDTDSRTTADSTDLTIVLKKDKAEAFKATIIGRLDEENARSAVEDGEEAPVSPDVEYDIMYSGMDIVKHCIYTVPIWGILVTVGGIIALIVALVSFGAEKGIHEYVGSVEEIVGGGIALLFVLAGAVKSVISDFFKYYEFCARREGDRIHLQYGLLKKYSYDIPVKRINSVIVTKSVISRFFGRSCVELVNVGLGDDNEESVKLLLSVKDSQIYDCLRTLLPEFAEYFDGSVAKEFRRQPKKIWVSHSFGFLVWLVLLIVIFLVLKYLAVLEGMDWLVYWSVAVGIMLFSALGCIGSYRANGLCIRDKYLVIASGMFAMSVQFVRYQKIQYMEFEQGPILRRLKMKSGQIYILASIMQNTISVPDFEETDIKEITERYLSDCQSSRGINHA